MERKIDRKVGCRLIGTGIRIEREGEEGGLGLQNQIERPTHACIHTHTDKLPYCVEVFSSTHTNTHTQKHMHTHTNTHTHTYIHTHTYTNTNTHTHTQTHTHIHKHTHINYFIYTKTTYIHTQTQLRRHVDTYTHTDKSPGVADTHP